MNSVQKIMLIALAVNALALSVKAQNLKYEVLLGEPVRLKIDDLKPGQLVRLTAKAAQGYQKWKRLYESTALFAADESGSVSLTQLAPKSAAWEGVDPAGLFWSMKSTGQPANPERSNNEITIDIDVDDNDTVDQSATVKLMSGFPEIVETPLGDQAVGCFVMRMPAKKPLPTVVLLGGSGGHDWSIRKTAPMLASRGFAVVGVPYFSPELPGGGPPVFTELPRDFNEIAIDQISNVIELIRRHPELDANRLALHGTSKGAEMALAAAERIREFDAVVAVTPSDFIYEGFTGVGQQARPSGGSSFTWQEEPLPFVPMAALSRAIEKHQLTTPLLVSKAIRKAIVDEPSIFEGARIAVEKITCPVFLVGGGADDVSDCGNAAKRIKDTRDNTADLETVIYFSEKATHSVGGTAYEPSNQADAQLKSLAFPAMIKFLRQNLKCCQ